MIGRARRAAALLALFLPAVLRAQEQTIVHAIDGEEVVVVRAVPFAGELVPGGFGFVAVEVENRDEVDHPVALEIASHGYGASSLAVRRDLLVGPGERIRSFLPLPTNADHGHHFDVWIDATHQHSAIGTSASAAAGLLITARDDREPWATTVLTALPPRHGGSSGVATAAPDDLPSDWRWWTGYRTVLVDGRAPIGGELQAALVDFASTGGLVVVADGDRLPAGELAERCRRGAVVGIGLGSCVQVPAEGDTTLLRERLASLPRRGASGWPVPAELLEEQVVPGLGEAPMLAFLLVILVFAVVVGPVNFVLLRRWRRPLLVLVTVPALGFGTTLLMLGYGLVADGFGVHGIVRSWTLLDQDRHEATSFAARTLFAGLSPARLEVATDGLVLAPRAGQRRGRRSPDHWRHDPVTNTVGGAVLPSRTATPLLSVRHGIARQRLRARVDGERLELLADGGVVPTGAVLLRDHDGRHWLGDAPALRPAGESEARAALERWCVEAGALIARDERGVRKLVSVRAFAARFAGGDELAPGSYVLRAESAPWLDEFGLGVDYDAAAHFVAGRLAAEDVVR